ncbi:MAG TPA: PglZ domain-containing protein [Clostridiales bacterium]|jgi:CheY-like chemotaxis protein|nr:PglZ domain-containing protein [Clostridiales bacterium]HQP68830.1 PglZ domain-containing protein [Clostridiales bacterium]
MTGKILWVDDEISLLRPHILYLVSKGYELETSTNGYDAIRLVKQKDFDLVILDEMMVGMDGLETLRQIKAADGDIKAVMVTKSEEEGIFLEAVGNMIDDYLTKPVSPLQLYLSIRKNLEKEDLISDNMSKNYIKNYKVISGMIDKDPDFNGWITINHMITGWNLRLDEIKDINLAETFDDLRRSANMTFGNYIQENYHKWISDQSERPVLSNEVLDKFVLPDLEAEKTAFIVIDCLPYDQMSVIEEVLKENFSIIKESYYSILPTATQFARNAIFSGLFPSEIEEKHPEFSNVNYDDESSSNRFEKELLEKKLISSGLDLGRKLKYSKAYRIDEFAKIESGMNELRDTTLFALVVNMVDFLVHDKKKGELVSEMMFNESSYRSTIKSWFSSSSLLRIITSLGEMGFRIVITTDHGAKLINKYTKVSGDGFISSGLRLKFGKNLTTSNKKQTFFWQKPADYKMPSSFKGMNIILAKEDHCFVFEKGLNDFYRQIKNSFQHGGVSLEEVILPVMILKRKNRG